MSSLFVETLCPNPQDAHPHLLVLTGNDLSRRIVHTFLSTAVEVRVGSLVAWATPVRWTPGAVHWQGPDAVDALTRQKSVDPDLCLTLTAGQLERCKATAHTRHDFGLLFNPLWLVTETL